MHPGMYRILEGEIRPYSSSVDKIFKDWRFRPMVATFGRRSILLYIVHIRSCIKSEFVMQVAVG